MGTFVHLEKYIISTTKNVIVVAKTIKFSSILIIFLQLLSKPTMQLLSKLIYFVTITLLVLHILLVVSFCNCICNYKNGGPTF